MGISTFLHLVSAREAAVLVHCPDGVIKAWLLALMGRPFLGEDAEEGVDGLAELRAALEEDSKGHGDVVYMECGSKFWEASLVAGMWVNVRFGKKGTEGRTNKYQGADARAYFDKKVKEKLKKRYKIVDKEMAAKEKALEVLGEDAAPEAKKAKSNVLHRVDLDRAGALTSYLVSRLTDTRLQDEDELFFSVLPHTKAGTDVSYGSVYLVTAEDAAQLAQKLAGVTRDDAAALFDDTSDFPTVLGGLCNVNQERDMEYGLLHYEAFVALLNEAAENEMGLVVHFW